MADGLLMYPGVVYWNVSVDVLSANDACISRMSASLRSTSQGVDRVSATWRGIVSGTKSDWEGRVINSFLSQATQSSV